jgi:colicin import membrane protein
MRKPKYPLESALRVREQKVDRAAQELAEKARAREDAEAKTRSSEEARRAGEAKSDALRSHEEGALLRGELRAADLMRGDAWEIRAHAEQDELKKREEMARANEDAARSVEDGARVRVGERRADANVIARDQEKWEGAQKKVRDAKDEEGAVEAWRPRRG